MGDEALKSCPFCGRTPVIESHPRMRGVPRRAATCYAIICRGCYLPRTEGFDRARVVSDWNQPRYDEVRIRAEAMAERTREVAAWMKRLAVTARGHRDRMAHIPASWQSFDDWANRLEVLAEEMEQEFDAFPKPGSTT